MRFFLVRHGQSEDNVLKRISGQSDVALTTLGKTQARALGEWLLERKVNFDVVYASDLPRAHQTAKIVCKMLGIKEIILDKRLREFNTGILTGRLSKSLTEEERELQQAIYLDLSRKIPGGESINDMVQRIREVFFEIVAKQPEDSTILLVAHGGTLYHILIRILHLLPEELDEWFGNCQVTVLERKSEKAPWQVTIFNNETIKRD